MTIQTATSRVAYCVFVLRKLFAYRVDGFERRADAPLCSAEGALREGRQCSQQRGVGRWHSPDRADELQLLVLKMEGQRDRRDHQSCRRFGSDEEGGSKPAEEDQRRPDSQVVHSEQKRPDCEFAEVGPAAIGRLPLAQRQAAGGDHPPPEDKSASQQ